MSIESCKAKDTGGIASLQQVFETASKDIQAAKSHLEKLVECEPKAVADSTVEEAQAILLTCKQHKEGLSKTLHKAKVLLD